jgi:hypothetical protein
MFASKGGVVATCVKVGARKTWIRPSIAAARRKPSIWRRTAMQKKITTWVVAAISLLAIGTISIAYNAKTAAAQSTHSIVALGTNTFTGDGSSVTFLVSIPTQPDNNYIPSVVVEDSGETIAYNIEGVTPVVFRVKFASPPLLSESFKVRWSLAY